MTVDRSPMWIGLADLLLCVLSVVIVAVAPTKAKVDGVKPKAEFLITADWPVALDSDVDLWLVGPDRKPVFYGSREAACASLDRDSLGFSTSQITLADGSMAQSESNKETTTIRCLAPGHYDIGVNLYSDRELAKGESSIPVRDRNHRPQSASHDRVRQGRRARKCRADHQCRELRPHVGRPDQAGRPAARADHRRLPKGQAVRDDAQHVRGHAGPSRLSSRQLQGPTFRQAKRRKKAMRKFLLRKAPRNPLISHDSHEKSKEIQGNPIGRIAGFRSQTRGFKKTQI